MTKLNYLHKWAMLPNADEFVVLKHHSDIKAYASEYMSASVPGIALQWLTFGHNNQVYTRDEPLSVRFTRRASHLFKTVKTMFVCAYVKSHHSPHFPHYNTTARPSMIMYGSKPGEGMRTSTQNQAFMPKFTHINAANASAMVFHFYNKSLEESITRRAFRLRPDQSHAGREIVSHESEIALEWRRNKTAVLVRVVVAGWWLGGGCWRGCVQCACGEVEGTWSAAGVSCGTLMTACLFAPDAARGLDSCSLHIRCVPCWHWYTVVSACCKIRSSHCTRVRRLGFLTSGGLCGDDGADR